MSRSLAIRAEPSFRHIRRGRFLGSIVQKCATLDSSEDFWQQSFTNKNRREQIIACQQLRTHSNNSEQVSEMTFKYHSRSSESSGFDRAHMISY